MASLGALIDGLLKCTPQILSSYWNGSGMFGTGTKERPRIVVPDLEPLEVGSTSTLGLVTRVIGFVAKCTRLSTN